ncbi:MAG: pitrilysin family protein [Verrucomicrobiota bacterium]
MDQSKHSSLPGAQDTLDRLFESSIERSLLPNGLTLLHRSDFSSEVVSVQVWVKTGSIHEGDLIGSGLSHYLEHLLFKGTSRREGKSISREVHAMGGSINAYTSFDRTVYYIDAPSSAFAQVIDVLEDIVLHSTLPEEEVERERDVILREIDMGLDDPDSRLNQALFRNTFRSHPSREPVIGHRELFERVTREELHAYYKARYVPNNMVVSIAGAISHEACLREVEKTFGKVPRGRLAPVIIPSEPEQLAPRKESIVGDYNIFRGGLAFKVPNLSHEDSPKLDALAHALGGGESALLWKELRNRLNLVHYISCRNWNPGAHGLFWISYLCDPQNAAAVEEAIYDLIERVKSEGFADADVEKARRQALSAEINGRKTMSGQASRQGLIEVVVGDIRYTERYLKYLGQVRPGDLQEVASKYLVEKGRTSVSLGPEDPDQVDHDDSSKKTVPAFEQVNLDNGARLLLQPDDGLPKVHLRCVMRGGPKFELDGQRGISELVAELLTKDNARRSADEVARLVEGIGGSFSATGGNNTVNLALEVLPGDLSIAVELLSDALLQPTFEQGTFETERESQIAGLREEEDEILDFGFKRLRAAYYGKDAFAIGASGSIADLESLSREDIVAHYARLVTAPNIVLSVCGDFERDSIVDALKPLLESLPAHELIQPEGGIHSEDLPLELKEAMDREQAVVLRAYPSAGIKDEDYVTSEMLNELFSGMSSRLFERVREDKGMAYYVGSTRVLGLDSGMFAFYAGTHPGQALEVMQEIDAEIERVRAAEVTIEEIERSRTCLKAARPMSRQTIGARAMHAAIQCIYGLPLNDDAEHDAKLDRIDAKTLADYVDRYFRPEKSISLFVGP